MTTRNDYIRQASIFTMGGLIDPTFEDEHNLATVKPKKRKGKGSLKFLFKAWKAFAIFFEGKHSIR